MQGDVQPPSNGEDRLEGEGFQDEGNDGGAEAENLAEDEEFAEGQPPEGLPGHRLTRRQVLIGGAIAGGALVGGGAGAIYLLLRSAGDEDQVAGERPTRATETPAPTEVPTQAPTPTATVPPRPRLEYVEDAPGAIEQRDWANGELIDWSHGLFAMNVNTGAVHGWRVMPELAKGQVAYAPYQFLGDGRYVAATLLDYAYVLDRETTSTVRMATERLQPELATAHYVVFAETEPEADDSIPYNLPPKTGKFYVTSPEWEQGADFRITLHDWSYGQYRFLIQPGGSTLAIVADGGSDTTVVELIDLEKGEHSEVYSPAPEMLRAEPGYCTLHAVNDQSFRVITDYGFYSAGQWRHSFNLTRDLSWGGRTGDILFTTAASDRLTFAPDGSFLRRQSLCGGQWDYDWPATAVYDRQGRPQWRIRSVDAGTVAYLPDWGWWLADGSGFIAAVRSDVREESFWYATVGREDGTITALPRPDVPPGMHWRRPAPSRHDARFVALNGALLLNRSTGQWLSPNLAAPGQISIHVDPWSGRSGEMAFGMPWGAQNPPQPPFGPFLQPLFERESFSECVSPLFRVAGTGSCLNLRASPDPGAQILTCLPEGKQVWLYSYGLPNPVVAGGDDVWIRISSEDRQVGWVSSDYLAWDVP
ncbi:MAG TPA: SH3 domain-containing protein [Tepidiformaceae bacterium]|nr:SH3 domain-containing protein [Tepidiformaceae bacterium]